jgi:hypothetical protein
VGLTTLPCKKKIVEKLPRNSAGFCRGGQGLSWAVEPRKEQGKKKKNKCVKTASVKLFLCLTKQEEEEEELIHILRVLGSNLFSMS